MSDSKDSNLKKVSIKKRFLAIIVLTIVISFFAMLYMASIGAFATDKTFGICGFKQQYQLPCPGCGMTTAGKAFVQGRVWESFYTQPAGAFLCVLVALAGILALFIGFFGVNFRFLYRPITLKDVKSAFLILIVIFLAGWAVTLARAIAAAN